MALDGNCYLFAVVVGVLNTCSLVSPAAVEVKLRREADLARHVGGKILQNLASGANGKKTRGPRGGIYSRDNTTIFTQNTWFRLQHTAHVH